MSTSALKQVTDELRKLSQTIQAVDGRSLSGVRGKLDEFLKSNGHYPAWLDVGINVFMEVYDWHIRGHLPIRILQMSEQRSAIQFMSTQLVLRWEVPDSNYLGIPYD